MPPPRGCCTTSRASLAGHLPRAHRRSSHRCASHGTGEIGRCRSSLSRLCATHRCHSFGLGARQYSPRLPPRPGLTTTAPEPRASPRERPLFAGDARDIRTGSGFAHADWKSPSPNDAGFILETLHQTVSFLAPTGNIGGAWDTLSAPALCSAERPYPPRSEVKCEAVFEKCRDGFHSVLLVRSDVQRAPLFRVCQPSFAAVTKRRGGKSVPRTAPTRLEKFPSLAYFWITSTSMDSSSHES